MASTAIFQIAIGTAGLMFLLLFLSEIDVEETDTEQKIVGALFLYTVSMFTLLIPATTRHFYRIAGLAIPPIQVWLEAIIMGFLISIAADIIYRE